MLRTAFVRRACSLFLEADVKCTRLARSRFATLNYQNHQLRHLSQTSKEKKPRSTNNPDEVPEPPPMTSEEIDFIKQLARNGDSNKNNPDFDAEGETTDLPEPPKEPASEWDFDIEEEVEDDEAVEDIEPVPYFPPIKKFDVNINKMQNLLMTSNPANTDVANSRESHAISSEVEPPTSGLKLDPSMEAVVAAWARAVVPTPASGPMPLHELANRSTKVKELVKLGVDFSKIAERHGDLEQLIQLNWEDQIKPQIRFFIDCGIEPNCLGHFFTRNTKLLWTDKDDMQVRINYLEAKHFTAEQIKNILNKAPFWLTLPTKELDGRLGFIQRTFKLHGIEVRQLASSFPTIVSSPRWEIFVDTTKLMDREFGFKDWERKKLLFTTPQCYMRPTKLRKAFDLCHNHIGLTHNQLVKHATLLVNRVNRMKPRHEFLKFLKRDVFDVWNPLYISPDWLWQGNIEEFCEQAAKSTVEEYEFFLKHSAAAI